MIVLVDGSLSSIPCAWDFPQVEDPADWGLREVQVATWGGFVFINPDPAAPTLTSHVGELTDHFARWPLEDRFVQVHVAKVIRCNWKVAQEAFMEAMHVVATHPQSRGEGSLVAPLLGFRLDPAERSRMSEQALRAEPGRVVRAAAGGVGGESLPYWLSLPCSPWTSYSCSAFE